jgi:hypothetical protein
MVNKRAYIRTMEAVFAIIIFLIALFGILSLQEEKQELKPPQIELLQDTILNEIEHNPTYRNEITHNKQLSDLESSEVLTFIQNTIPDSLEFDTVVCHDPSDPSGCPEPDHSGYNTAEKVYADSVILSKEEGGSITSKLFTLYLWSKLE